MEMRVFGSTGMQVSLLGFGCGGVGGLMVRGAPADQDKAVARARIDPQRVCQPLLEAEIVGEARDQAGVTEADRRKRGVLRQVDRQMRSDRGRSAIADEDHPAGAFSRAQPERASGRYLVEDHVIERDRAMQTPHIIVEESAVI